MTETPAKANRYLALGLGLLVFALFIPIGYYEQAQIRLDMFQRERVISDNERWLTNLGLFGVALALGLTWPRVVFLAIAGRMLGGFAFYHSAAFAPQGEMFLVMWILLIWLAVKDAIPCLIGAFAALALRPARPSSGSPAKSSVDQSV